MVFFFFNPIITLLSIGKCNKRALTWNLLLSQKVNTKLANTFQYTAKQWKLWATHTRAVTSLCNHYLVHQNLNSSFVFAPIHPHSKGQTMILSFTNCRNGLNAASKARKQGAKPVAYACNSLSALHRFTWLFWRVSQIIFFSFLIGVTSWIRSHNQ